MDSFRELIFVSSAIQQPRHQKRIRTLGTGFRVFVIYSERILYSENIKTFDHPAELKLSLGAIENKKYYKRIGTFLRLLNCLRSRDENIVYCTSLESAFAAILTRKKVILELGDLHQFQSFSTVYRLIDKWLVPKLSLLVLTSPDFLTEYYAVEHHRHRSKFLVVENKLTSEMTQRVEKFRAENDGISAADGRVRLGLIGYIRYKRSLEAIRDLVLKREDLEIHIFGDGDIEMFMSTPRCFIHGAFENPADLPRIYASIDVNLILYDTDNRNVTWALPNKLYESIAFQKPILCSNNCSLGDRVVSNDFGVASSIDSLSANLDILLHRYAEIVKNLQAANSAQYIDDGTELVKNVKELG